MVWPRHRNKLFQLSCSVKGYNPKRWQVVRRQPIGDLYEAMYQSDLKEDPLFEASVRGALVYQSTRQKEALDKFDKIDSDDDDGGRGVHWLTSRNWEFRQLCACRSN